MSINNSDRAGISLRELLARARVAVEHTLPDPVWVRAEVSKATFKAPHLYLDLVERDSKGEVAKINAVRWYAGSLLSRFHQQSGQELTADLQVLVQVRVEVQDRYGLRLKILDIDAAYTVGIMAQQLKIIRQTLEREGIIHRNRQLVLPEDFFSVAVISPEGAAGLADFRAGADPLARFGVCQFHYFPALFQGSGAKDSLLQALARALQTPGVQALAIIRGGGAAADLHWLNELELARAICRCPVPVITGIGHEHDQTILDEVASRKEGTPSKVIELIRAALGEREKRTQADVDRIRNIIRERLGRAEQAVAQEVNQFRWATDQQWARAADQVVRDQGRVAAGARQALAAAEVQTRQARQALGERAWGRLAMLAQDVQRLGALAPAQVRGQTRAAARELAMLRQRVAQASQWQLEQAARRLTEGEGQVRVHTERLVRQAATQVAEAQGRLLREAERTMRQAAEAAEQWRREIEGQGPQRTLQRGFALVRDATGRPVTSRAVARQQERLQLEFYDGAITVRSDEYESHPAGPEQF